MNDPDLWHKSTYSHSSGGSCVEVAENSTGAKVRDTENRELGHLEFGRREWAVLLRTAL